MLRGANRPLVIAGGGGHYSGAVESLRLFAEQCRLPVVETVAGKSSLRWDHPNFVGPIGVTGSTSANEMAAEADVVLAVGTRLQDFTTGSWSVFRNPGMRLVILNAAPLRRGQAHGAIRWSPTPRRGLEALAEALGELAVHRRSGSPKASSSTRRGTPISTRRRRRPHQGEPPRTRP